jgi:putative methyltransferase (TIGR04325 family)
MAISEQPQLWEGVYGSFAEARGDGTVFRSETWLTKLAERARVALARAASDDAIAPVAVTHDYALPYVAALAAKPEKMLRVLDFGGGLGASFLPLVGMLPEGQPLDYVIVENESVGKLGRRMFADDRRVSFRTDIPATGECFDIVHCGSSLHYVDNWLEALAQFVDLQPTYLVISDLPAADNRTFVTAQQFHGRRIPVHFWNLREFVASAEAVGFELALKARFVGYHDAAGGVARFSHFGPEYRLDYFSQLIFRRTASARQ